MSWSVTLDQLQEIPALPENILDKIGEDNPQYKEDAQLAFTCAKSAGLVSATLTGGRTPNPYSGANVVVISITGFDSDKTGVAVPPPSFNETMRHMVTAPPYPYSPYDEIDEEEYDEYNEDDEYDPFI